MKLSVITIHYHAPEMVNALIRSVNSDAPELAIEYIVVDNSGGFNLADDLMELTVRVLEPGYNSGFARGVNLGLKAATGEFIMVINQDAYLQESKTIELLLDQLRFLPSKTILSCMITDEQNGFQESIWLDDPGIMREWRWGAIYHKLHPDWKEKLETQKRTIHEKSGYVPRINGAVFMLRNDQNVKEACFDDDFFLYGEDIEWAMRLRKAGWKFYYDTAVTIKHAGSTSTPITDMRTLQVTVSDWLVLRKIHGRLYLLITLKLIVFNLFTDWLLRILYHLRKKQWPIEWTKAQQVREKIIKYALKKYAWTVLFQAHLSTNTTFVLNCYEHDQEFIKEIERFKRV